MKNEVRVIPIKVAGRQKWAVVLNGDKGKKPFCLRCGMDKKEIKKENLGCSLYGKHYKKHVYK